MSNTRRLVWDLAFIVALACVGVWIDWQFIRKVASSASTAQRLEALERRVDALEGK